MKLLIIIPTYNEKENIAQLVPEIVVACPEVHMLVVDDNSPDKTAAVVSEMQKKYPQLNLLNREKKQGLGRAYLAGFKWALQKQYDAVLEMDADFSHPVEAVPRFLKAIQEYDMVAGSRWISEGGVKNWPLHRVFLSYFANLYSRLILGVALKDLTGGFTCYRRQVLESIPLDEVESDGYSFQIEMKYRVIRKGFRVKEIPFIFTDRKFGHSKISRRIVFEALGLVWKFRWTL